MPILIVNHSQQQHALPLNDRVLIGRRPFNTVVLADPEVSRLHAWIGRRDARWVLFDAGSRQGTFVNERAIDRPHALADGDEIRVGQAVLSYHESDEAARDISPMEAAAPLPASDPYDGGIYFDCACGGPMWVAAGMAGSTGRCRYCGTRLVVPHQSGGKARPLTPPTMEGETVPARGERGTSPRSPRGERERAPAPPRGERKAPLPTRGERKTKKAPPASRRPASPAAGKVAPAANRPIDTAVKAAAAPAPAPTNAAQAKRAASPAAEPVREDAPAALCSICQSPILAAEEETTCPSCQLAYHRQCWEENFGCGAYGCDQVNVLAPHEHPIQESAAAEVPSLSTQHSALNPQHSSLPTQHSALSTQHSALNPQHSPLDVASNFPWESVLLALSFVATALGALAFGVPSVIMLIWTIVFLARRRSARKGMVIGAMVVSLLGALAGGATSLLWWKQIRVWELFFK